MKFSKPVAITCLMVLLLLITFNTYAQFTPPDTPCDPEDVTCPIDTWVVLVAGMALIATTFYLYQKQKLFRDNF